MIIVTMTHFVRPGQIAQARRRIRSITEQMAAQPGLVFRHVGGPPGEPDQIVTVTAWQSKAHLDAWEAGRPAPSHDAGQSPYDRLERLLIEVGEECWSASAPGQA